MRTVVMAAVTGYAEVISPYATAPGALRDGPFGRFRESRKMAVEGEKLQRPGVVNGRAVYAQTAATSTANGTGNDSGSPKPQPAIVARTVYSPSGTATASRSSDV